VVFVRRYVDGNDMARKNKYGKLVQKKENEKQYGEVKLLRHIARLNLRTKDDYKAWCAQHGFSGSLKKTDLQRQTERQKYAQTVSIQRLRQHSRERKLRAQILKISNGDVNSQALASDVLVEIHNGFRKCRAPDVLLQTLLYLERYSNLLSEKQHVQGVVALVSHHSSWKRPVQQWRPKKHSAHRQFSALSRYLLADYDVPVFMDNVWFSTRN